MRTHRGPAIVIAALAAACALAAFVLLPGGASTPARAGGGNTVQVGQMGNSYTPSSITIDPGDTVTWEFVSNTNHTVTSNTGLFDSGTANMGDPDFSFQFNNSGTFNYHCEIHGGMTGVVNVTGGEPTNTPTSEPTPSDTPTSEPTPTDTPTTEPTPSSTATSEPTPSSTPTSEPTPSSTPSSTPTGEPTDTPTSTPTSEPLQFDLFEGWNLIADWPGPELSDGQAARGTDEITAFFEANVDPPIWDALAVYDPAADMWGQHFADPPLPAFQTLDTIEPSDDLWIFVLSDATLTIP
jgi:plastocyanin